MSEAFRVVTQQEGIEELELLDNGLRVLLVPDATVPVTASCIVYQVGSRNEAVGHTGSTHLLEHLMFKGSRRFDPAKGRPIARALERVGASFNATTWFDRTNYFETLPAEHLELALELEADRMRHALLRAEDLASEMTVVRNEFERGENDPFDALLKQSFATAFREHPYHHPTIGWRSDIENVTIERLRTFYDTFYYPDNASLILVGALDRVGALELVARHFGPLPRAPQPIVQRVTAEPRQEGERRFVIRRAAEIGWVSASWRVPEAGHADTYPLAVLADALSGGVTGRLYQKLVETGKCLEVQAFSWQLRDPGLFQVFAALNPPTAHAEVEAVIREELAAVARDGLTSEELDRARAQVEAQTAFHRDSPSQVAAAIAEAISAATWQFYLEYPRRITEVHNDDVIQAATQVFDDDALSVGWFVPRNGQPRTGGEGVPHAAHPGPKPCGYRPGISGLIEERTLDDGGRVLMLPRRANPTVHVQGLLLAGHALVESERWSASALLPDMLERGTARHDRLSLARCFEDRGIELAIAGESFNPFEVVISGRCLSRHLDLLLELLVEMLREPTFPAEELEKLRQLRLGELAQAQEETFLRAYEVFTRLLFPPGHPCYRRPLEERRLGLERVSRDDVARVHTELFGPASLVLGLVGDFEPDDVARRLGGLLSGWRGGIAGPPDVPRRTARDVTAAVAREAMADKPNLDVLLGHPGGLRRTDEDFLAATLGNSVLGQSTLSSRLGRRLRDTEGLTYGVVSRFFGAGLIDGPWATTFSVAPHNLERGIASARDEIARLVENGPDVGELEDEKAALAGSYRVSLAVPSGMAREMVKLARYRLPLSLLDTLPDEVLATTRERVTAALQRHLDPGRLSLAVAGSLVDPPAGQG